MYIAPSTNIKILKDVPLDKTYDHTIYFESANDQYTYFASKVKYTQANCTYQRVNKETIRVGLCADLIYDCNYLMFQNTNFGSKWFYAFINKIEYINNDVAEITYEIDDIQTWFFDFTFDQCFVEREHTESDEMFEHYESEPVQISGDYIHMDTKYVHEQDLIFCMMYTDGDTEIDKKGAVNSSRVYDNVYTGWRCYLTNKKATLDSKINSIVGTSGGSERIRSIYMIPNPQYYIEGGVKTALTDAILQLGVDLESGNTGLNVNTEIVESDLRHPISTTKLAETEVTSGVTNGYLPRNKKLYCYPYHFYNVNNNAGSSMCLRYEFFHSNTVQLHVNSTLLQPVQENLCPVGYKGTNVSGIDFTGDTNEMLSIVNFPTCNWSFDAYTAWLNNEFVPMAIGTGSSIIGSGLGAMMNPLLLPSVATNASTQVGNILQQNYRASIQADITKGNSNTGGVTSAMGLKTFIESRCSLPQQELEILDDYFSMYGYCVKRCKTPNRNVRERWCFVKTVGCCITGSVPSDSMAHICRIHDNGITYWKQGAYVGKYRDANGDMYANAPVTQGE